MIPAPTHLMKNAPFINRELSWLDFNARVLEEARDADNPLLERVKFLAISANNLDEFFMVRVGGLQLLEEQRIKRRDVSGLTPREQLEAISERCRDFARAQDDCWNRELVPGLREQGIQPLKASELDDVQTARLERIFDEEIYPVVTPMVAPADQDFPLVRARSLVMLVRLAPVRRGGRARYALLPLGTALNRIVPLSGAGSYSFVMLEDLVRMFAAKFFPGETVLETSAFRVTRNADMAIREDLAADLLKDMRKILDARKDSDCVRLEIESGMSRDAETFLARALGVGEREILRTDGLADYSGLMSLSQIRGHEDLRDDPWPPQPSPLADPRESIFKAMARGPILLVHPFESFDPVVRLVQEAAEDESVIAIKQILYRTSRNSPVVNALIRAADKGKHVTVIVELKARFDEQRNIDWATALEKAGAQVIYGVQNLKTHAKVCIVVRREPAGLRRYVHFGTGNYNDVTARLYTDASYLTVDPELGADASQFFNTITGYSQPQSFRRLAAAPLTLRERLLELIEGETARRAQGQKARITAKMNSLADPEIIEALYRASQAGVKIQLNVRGVCCLQPGVPGVSENIEVVSVLDRFLEHTRVFCFHHGGDRKVFISSADWMTRNLDKRVELLVPVDDRASRDRLIHVLDVCLADNVKARRLQADGTYTRTRRGVRAPALRSQEILFDEARAAAEQKTRAQRNVFVPYTSGRPGPTA